MLGEKGGKLCQRIWGGGQSIIRFLHQFGDIFLSNTYLLIRRAAHFSSGYGCYKALSAGWISCLKAKYAKGILMQGFRFAGWILVAINVRGGLLV